MDNEVIVKLENVAIERSDKSYWVNTTFEGKRLSNELP